VIAGASQQLEEELEQPAFNFADSKVVVVSGTEKVCLELSSLCCVQLPTIVSSLSFMMHILGHL
jgi:hypothetical protein